MIPFAHPPGQWHVYAARREAHARRDRRRARRIYLWEPAGAVAVATAVWLAAHLI